jgi:hypothetical protein
MKAQRKQKQQEAMDTVYGSKANGEFSDTTAEEGDGTGTEDDLAAATTE